MYSDINPADSSPSTRSSPTRRPTTTTACSSRAARSTPTTCGPTRTSSSFLQASPRRASRSRAICHGPWTLVEADLVRDRTLTSYPSIRTDIRNAGGNVVDEEVVCRRRARDEPQPGRPAGVQREGHRGASGLLEAVGDAAAAEVVRRHLDADAIARQHADAEATHLARPGDRAPRGRCRASRGTSGWAGPRDLTLELHLLFYWHITPLSR